MLKIFIVQEEDDEAWKMGIPADVRAEVIERCEEVLKAMRPKNADRVPATFFARKFGMELTSPGWMNLDWRGGMVMRWNF